VQFAWLWETEGVANFRQIPVEQVKASVAASRVNDKPTSEELRREADKLRETATKLMEYAATLIARSADLEKRVLQLQRNNSKPSRKP
jgi:hypothetical protein